MTAARRRIRRRRVKDWLSRRAATIADELAGLGLPRDTFAVPKSGDDLTSDDPAASPYEQIGLALIPEHLEWRERTARRGADRTPDDPSVGRVDWLAMEHWAVVAGSAAIAARDAALAFQSVRARSGGAGDEARRVDHTKTVEQGCGPHDRDVLLSLSDSRAPVYTRTVGVQGRSAARERAGNLLDHSR